eukprot:8803605-Pyramimonas_sp.AAC.1
MVRVFLRCPCCSVSPFVPKSGRFLNVGPFRLVVLCCIRPSPLLRPGRSLWPGRGNRHGRASQPGSLPMVGSFTWPSHLIWLGRCVRSGS